MRWRQELKKFGGLNGRIYGLDGCEANAVMTYTSSDVVMCDYASLLQLYQSDEGCMYFSSLVLDLRHPPSDTRTAVKSPIESVKWWIWLNNFIMKCPTSMKRLVIEQSDLPHNRFFFPMNDKDLNVNSSKRTDEILAMKLAFTYHPSIFFSERGSTGKRVISWAKRQAKAETTSRTSTGGDNASCPLDYRSVLASSLQSMYDYIVDVKQPDHEIDDDEVDESSQNSNHAWEVRMCLLARPQQVVYDQCCAGVRGDSDNEAVVASLLKLRKICFHSELDDIMASLFAPLLQARHGSGSQRGSEKIGSLLVHTSATFSESNIDMAMTIIKKSSKMKELLRVLITECGHNVVRKSELSETSTDDVDEGNMSTKAKVLILATLVEAQLLTSFVLSAVGLHHEVLVSSIDATVTREPSSQASKSFAESVGSEWAWGQDILSRFNGSGHRSIDIIIASPKALSSQNGGVGVTSADVVISIDEDWSGREALHIMSMFSKIRRHELGKVSARASSSSLTKATCKFIKLVCQNTCEDTFLCKGNITTNDSDIDGSKPAKKLSSKRETHKRGGVKVSRKSSRQSTRAVKTNEDDAKMDADGNDHISPAMHLSAMPPTSSPVNSDGFLVPPPAVDDAKRSINECFIGSNIVRYRNNKLSSVLCPSSAIGSISNELFLETKSGQDHSDRVLAWALFKVEDDASFFSTGRLSFRSHVPKMELVLGSITPSPAATSSSLLSSKSAKCHVESFRRSSSFASQEQNDMPITLWDALPFNQADNANTSSNDSFGNEAICDSNDSKLLVYPSPNAASIKRDVPDVEFTVEGGKSQGREEDLPQSTFSVTFSSLNIMSSAAVQDGNQGCEPSLYFPAFLPSLLSILLNSDHPLPQANTLSGMKRKDVVGDIGNKSKRLRASSPCAGFHESDSVSVETNPHSFWEDRNEYGNAELNFHRKLLASDLKGAFACQNQPPLKSMLLVVEKKQHLKGNAAVPVGNAGHVPSNSTHKNVNNAGKKSQKKQIKTQHQPSATIVSTQERQTPSYFSNEHLYDQSFSARKGLKINFAASLMGTVKHRCRLNDLVSNSFTQAVIKSNRPLLVDQRGKTSQFVTSISSSELEEESSEPWTDTEDSILEECVKRYGMNWQFIAQALASRTTVFPGKLSLQRSAAQCQNRWLSLESKPQNQPSTSSTIIDEIATPAINNEISLFGNISDRPCKESIIYDNSSLNRLKKESSESGSSLWLGTSNITVPDIHNPSHDTKEKSQHVLSRIQMIREASKKRRVVTIPLPTSGPIHPSHAEAVQTARASMLSSSTGIAPPRHEMWPLELLDFRKKQKQMSRESRSSSSSNSAHPPSSQSSNHQQSSIPYQPNHNIHPTQQQMYHGQHPAYLHQQGHAMYHAGFNPTVAHQPTQPRAPQQQTSTKRS